MTSSTEQERAEFEAVASDNGQWPQAIERDAKGDYLLMTTAIGWMWWQAARRAPAAPQAVPVPPFTPLAQRKLDDLLAQGFRVTGYALEHCNSWSDNRRCTVDSKGLVLVRQDVLVAEAKAKAKAQKAAKARFEVNLTQS